MGVGRPRSCRCGTCKKCKHADYVRARYQRMTPEKRREEVARRDKDRVRRQDRERAKQPQRIARAKENTKRWRAEDPRRLRAHNTVARAIARGDLVRQPCEVCGAVKSHAHHANYDEPLHVQWLCAIHHAEVEGRNKPQTATYPKVGMDSESSDFFDSESRQYSPKAVAVEQLQFAVKQLQFLPGPERT